MPCTYWEPNTPDPGSGASYANLQAQIAEQKSKLDDLTNMLCSLCRAMEDNGGALDIDFMPENITSWWTKHKAADTRKRKAEAKAKKLKELKEKALAKLTKEERAALGI